MDLPPNLGPDAWAAIFLALFLALLVLLALTWRWFVAHREALWRAAAGLWRAIRESTVVRHAQRRYPGAWRFVAARLSPEGYLGLHLTLGLLVSVGALVLFGVVAQDMLQREELAAFDHLLPEMLRDWVTPRGLALFMAVSWLGSATMLATIGIAVAVLLLGTHRRLLLLGWVAALGGAGLLDTGLKLLFRRPRPAGAELLLAGHSWSFPSGHSMGSLVAYGMLAYLTVLFIRSARGRAAVVVAAAALVLAIGFSRLYLGVHYFTDVIGGFAAGVVWLSACISGIEVARRRRQQLA